MSPGYSAEHVDGLFVLAEWTDDLKGPFGLQPSPGDWNAFTAHIEELKERCHSDEVIKVFYAGRHGQGEHNVLGEKYGWEEAEEQFPWVDPPLTALGVEQAESLATAFKREQGRGMPHPTLWFVSPLRRCGETLQAEWGWYCKEKNGNSAIPAQVVENLREHLNLHSWNHYHTLTESKARFPHFSWPSEMTEEDEFYAAQAEKGRDETEEELKARAEKAVETVLQKSEGHTYISVTSHQGALRGLWAALGVPQRALKVGEMNVLVVKVKRTE